MMKSKKGNVILYFIFILLSLGLLIFTTIVAPMGAYISAKTYAVGDKFMNMTGDAVFDGISDPTIKADLLSTTALAQDSTALNITIMSAFYQYSWIIIIAGSLILFILLSRVLVEQNRSSGFV